MTYPGWFEGCSNGEGATARPLFPGCAAPRRAKQTRASSRRRRSSRRQWLRLRLKPARLTRLCARSIVHSPCQSRTGLRWYEAETHRIRGAILLKRDPHASPLRSLPNRDRCRTRAGLAQLRTARGAALSLAKLYRSAGRHAEAHAVLALALEGLVATPQMNEIVDGRALLAALAGTDEVRAQLAQRHRLTQLLVSYGNALIAARAFAAPETGFRLLCVLNARRRRRTGWVEQDWTA
jgi:hypothetical protein